MNDKSQKNKIEISSRTPAAMISLSLILLLSLVLLLQLQPPVVVRADTYKKYTAPDGSVITYTIDTDEMCCTIKGWKGTSEVVEIPAEFDGLPVTYIGKNSFYDKEIKEIIIPEHVKEIQAMAFMSCDQLTKAVLPDGLVSIERFAFFTCESLSEIVLPEGLVSIGDSAFFGCTMLEEIQLPQSLKTLGCGSLNNTGLKKISLPDGLEEVGYNPFAHTSLEELIISPDHRYLEYEDGVLYSRQDHRLVGCAVHALLPAHYEVKEGTEIIDECAFVLCRELESISIPEGVRDIRAFAFHGCPGLTDIPIPASVRELGSWAFCSCHSLTEIVIPEGVESLPAYVIQDCPALTRVVVPSSAISINENFIYECPQAVLVVDKGSTAEEVARKRGYSFIYNDGSKPAKEEKGTASSDTGKSDKSKSSSPKEERTNRTPVLSRGVLRILIWAGLAVLIIIAIREILGYLRSRDQ